jgi:flagellar protein FlbD
MEDEMIVVHRLNGSEFVINAHAIELVEGNPDTVIMLNTERKYVVKESVQDIIDKVVAFNRTTFGRQGIPS